MQENAEGLQLLETDDGDGDCKAERASKATHGAHRAPAVEINASSVATCVGTTTSSETLSRHSEAQSTECS